MRTSASRDAPDRDVGMGDRMTSVPRDAVARGAADYPRAPLPLRESILWYPAGRGKRDTGARGGYPVFIEQSTLDAIRSHIESSPGDPLLGFLAGQLYMCSDIEAPYIVVDGVFVCRYPIENDDPSPLFQRVWDRLQNEVQRRRTQVVGWYRSAPRGDVHLGPLDVAVHEAHFPEPWQLVIVARPDRRHPAGGVYRQAPGTSWAASPISFYERLDSAPRRSVGGKRTRLTWKNYHSSELVLAADERGVRPGDDEPPPATDMQATRDAAASERNRITERVPALDPATAAADERKRPTLRVVRTLPARPQAPEPPRPATDAGVAAPARTTVPTPRPRATVPTTPVDDTALRAVPGRRRFRYLVTLAAVCGLVAAGGLGALLVVERSTLDEGVPVDAHAARLARLDRVADTLSPALHNYDERSALYRDGILGCPGLARGYAAVDTLWSVYANTRTGLQAPLDSGRQARETRLASQVDGMRREFVRAGCPAP